MAPTPVGWRITTALAKETTYGTELFPTGTKFLHAMDGDTMTAEQGNIAEPDFANVPDRIGAIRGIRSLAADLRYIVRPSGTQGTKPDIDEVLTGSLFPTVTTNTADAVQASPAPTTTAYAILTAGNVTAKTFVVTDGTGYSEPELRFCTANSSGTLTVTPAHSAAPTAADVVDATNTWAMGARTVGLTYYLWASNDADTQVYSEGAIGWFPERWTLDWSSDADGLLTMSWSGPGNGNHVTTGTDALDGAINSSVTTVGVDELRNFSVGSKILINSEAMEVTAKSADSGAGNLTVTRGFDSTVAASHSDNDPIYPYRGTVTLTAGDPISANYCTVIIGTGSTEFEATSVSISIGQAVGQQRDATQDDLVARMTAGRIDGTCEITGWVTDGNTAEFLRGRDLESVAVFVQWGNTLGKLFAAYMPQVYFKIVPMSQDGEEGLSVVMSGDIRGTSAGNDSIYLGS